MIKRLICFILTGIMIFMSFGCGTAERKGKIVLALRAGIYADVIKQCLPEFEKTHGVTCEIYEFSESDLQSYVLNDSVLRTGSYDLCMVDGSWVAEYVDEGVLANIGALGCKIDSDIIPATAGICVQNGKTYLMPYYGNVTVLMYNTDLAETLGMSEDGIDSLDDLESFCRKVQQSGKSGFIYRGDTDNNIVVDFLPILCAFGGWVVDKNNRPTVNTTEFEKAVKFYKELIATGKACAKDELIKGIEDGEMAVAIGWPGWYDPTDHKGMDYVSLPGRVSSGSRNHNSNIYGIWTLGITANSPNKELAAELLNYLMDPEVQKSTVDNGGVPCRYSSLTDPEKVETDPHLTVICKALENGIYRPVMRDWTKFYTILGDNMRKILNGSGDISEILALTQAELEAMLNGK